MEKSSAIPDIISITEKSSDVPDSVNITENVKSETFDNIVKTETGQTNIPKLKTLADLIGYCRDQGFQVYNNVENIPESDKFRKEELEALFDGKKHCSDDGKWRKFRKTASKKSEKSLAFSGISRRQILESGGSSKTRAEMEDSKSRATSAFISLNGRSQVTSRLSTLTATTDYKDANTDTEEILKQRMRRRFRRKRENTGFLRDQLTDGRSFPSRNTSVIGETEATTAGPSGDTVNQRDNKIDAFNSKNKATTNGFIDQTINATNLRSVKDENQHFGSDYNIETKQTETGKKYSSTETSNSRDSASPTTETGQRGNNNQLTTKDSDSTLKTQQLLKLKNNTRKETNMSDAKSTTVIAKDSNSSTNMDDQQQHGHEMNIDTKKFEASRTSLNDTLVNARNSNTPVKKNDEATMSNLSPMLKKNDTEKSEEKTKDAEDCNDAIRRNDSGALTDGVSYGGLDKNTQDVSGNGAEKELDDSASEKTSKQNQDFINSENQQMDDESENVIDEVRIRDGNSTLVLYKVKEKSLPKVTNWPDSSSAVGQFENKNKDPGQNEESSEVMKNKVETKENSKNVNELDKIVTSVTNINKNDSTQESSCLSGDININDQVSNNDLPSCRRASNSDTDKNGAQRSKSEKVNVLRKGKLAYKNLEDSRNVQDKNVSDINHIENSEALIQNGKNLKKTNGNHAAGVTSLETTKKGKHHVSSDNRVVMATKVYVPKKQIGTSLKDGSSKSKQLQHSKVVQMDQTNEHEMTGQKSEALTKDTDKADVKKSTESKDKNPNGQNANTVSVGQSTYKVSSAATTSSSVKHLSAEARMLLLLTKAKQVNQAQYEENSATLSILEDTRKSIKHEMEYIKTGGGQDSKPAEETNNPEPGNDNEPTVQEDTLNDNSSDSGMANQNDRQKEDSPENDNQNDLIKSENKTSTIFEDTKPTDSQKHELDVDINAAVVKSIRDNASKKIDASWDPSHPMYDAIKSGFKSTAKIPDTRKVSRALKKLKTSKFRSGYIPADGDSQDYSEAIEESRDKHRTRVNSSFRLSPTDNVYIEEARRIYPKVLRESTIYRSKTQERKTTRKSQDLRNHGESQPQNIQDDAALLKVFEANTSVVTDEHFNEALSDNKQENNKTRCTISREKTKTDNLKSTKVKTSNQKEITKPLTNMNDRLEVDPAFAKEYKKYLNTSSDKAGSKPNPPDRASKVDLKHRPSADKNSSKIKFGKYSKSSSKVQLHDNSPEEPLANGYVKASSDGQRTNRSTKKTSEPTKANVGDMGENSSVCDKHSEDIPISTAVDIVQSRKKFYHDQDKYQKNETRGHRVYKLFREIQIIRRFGVQTDSHASLDKDEMLISEPHSGFLVMDYNRTPRSISLQQTDSDLNNFLHSYENYEVCSKVKSIVSRKRDRALENLRQKIALKLI